MRSEESGLPDLEYRPNDQKRGITRPSARERLRCGARLSDPPGCAKLSAMTHDATALLNDVLRLPENERIELASRLFSQESSVISAQPGVMSGAPVFKGTRVLAQTLIEYLEAGDSIDDFLEGYPSVTREQVIAFLEETKARVLAYAG